MTEPTDLVAADLRALSDVPQRFAGTEGERAMLRALRERLPADVKSKIEGFVDHVSPAFWTALHAALLLAFGVLGVWWPGPAAALCALVTLSLIGEGTGRFRLVRWAAPRFPSYNLTVRIDPARPLGAVVLTAPLDIPRWRPLELGRFRFRPMQLVLTAAIAVTFIDLFRSLAEPWGPRTRDVYVAALVVLGVAVLLGAVAYRLAEERQEASGPAALLDLVRRLSERPPENVQVWAVFTGCGRAFQGGMNAFLTLHGRAMPEPVLVVALDDPGAGALRATASEGTLFARPHRPTGPALVERLGWAGVSVPLIDRIAATDARAATLRGYRAVALTGSDATATPEATRRAAEVAETLVRWFDGDLARVAGDRTRQLETPHERRVAR